MKFESKRILYAVFVPSIFIILFGIIYVLQWDFNLNLEHFGIFPRETQGLLGIITSPFIHANFKHLFSNTIPFLILGWCLFYFYKDLAYIVFPIIWISSGFITWCIGRESWHIGASGVIYGLSFFLFFSGIFRKYIPLMAISLLVTFLYGSMVFNMLPVSQWVYENISWEGHLSGAISGLICAVLFRKEGPQKPESPFAEEDEDEDEEINQEGQNTEQVKN